MAKNEQIPLLTQILDELKKINETLKNGKTPQVIREVIKKCECQKIVRKDKSCEHEQGQCAGGLVEKESTLGIHFLGCNQYPKCWFTENKKE